MRLYDCYPKAFSSYLNAGASTPLPCNQAKGIEIVHQVDLTDGNKEIITRFSTNISHAGYFYTDSNGFGIFASEYLSVLSFSFDKDRYARKKACQQPTYSRQLLSDYCGHIYRDASTC